MQREFYYDNKPHSEMWDKMWSSRTIEQELETCTIESPPRNLFLNYLSKVDKIIDAGCGFGKWVVFLHRLGYNIWGIDNNELAISKLKNFDDTLQVDLGDIFAIPYPDNYFDAYISMGVIEHFEEGPNKVLNEAFRLIRPRGLIFVSVPTVNIIRKLIRRSLRNTINYFLISLKILKSGTPGKKFKEFIYTLSYPLPEKIKKILMRKRERYYHFMEYRYSKHELESFLNKAGFEIIETLPHDFYGSKDHSVGLGVDFWFLESPKGVNFQLTPLGRWISRTLNSISPWIACSSVITVARSLKK
jgi:SAM-dependent methyltransferase